MPWPLGWWPAPITVLLEAVAIGVTALRTLASLVKGAVSVGQASYSTVTSLTARATAVGIAAVATVFQSGQVAFRKIITMLENLRSQDPRG